MPKHPCNCFGVCGRFELDQYFHEMGSEGCVRTIPPSASLTTTLEKALAHDPVAKPDHYRRFKFEPIRFIMENNLPFWMGNVVKYVLRAQHKNGLEDLKKARRYLDMQIAKMEGNEDFWK